MMFKILLKSPQLTVMCCCNSGIWMSLVLVLSFFGVPSPCPCPRVPCACPWPCPQTQSLWYRHWSDFTALCFVCTVDRWSHVRLLQPVSWYLTAAFRFSWSRLVKKSCSSFEMKSRCCVSSASEIQVWRCSSVLYAVPCVLHVNAYDIVMLPASTHWLLLLPTTSRKQSIIEMPSSIWTS